MSHIAFHSQNITGGSLFLFKVAQMLKSNKEIKAFPQKILEEKLMWIMLLCSLFAERGSVCFLNPSAFAGFTGFLNLMH